MPDGSCICGKCTTRLSGPPQYKALCHCTDCRKITGSTYSTNLFVPASAFALVAGASCVREYSKASAAGNRVTSFFCAECGVTLWRESSGLPGVKFVKEGTMDVGSDEGPAVEYFTGCRVAWVPSVPGARQDARQESL